MNLQDLCRSPSRPRPPRYRRGSIVSLALAFRRLSSASRSRSAYWLNTPNYGVLFSDMDPEAGRCGRDTAEGLEGALHPRGRRPNGQVPTSRIDELRLDVAAQGMPGTGRMGFEIFDRTSFGVTDFMEHVNYRRALEGELARTISTIAEVARRPRAHRHAPAVVFRRSGEADDGVCRA